MESVDYTFLSVESSYIHCTCAIVLDFILRLNYISLLKFNLLCRYAVLYCAIICYAILCYSVSCRAILC